jgi:hypothetical protein
VEPKYSQRAKLYIYYLFYYGAAAGSNPPLEKVQRDWRCGAKLFLSGSNEKIMINNYFLTNYSNYLFIFYFLCIFCLYFGYILAIFWLYFGSTFSKGG